uniref:Box C/D snoRNA protein 1 n=1 Tax=Cannabis sativa TaxID=3483 RepID=A0A803PFQ4_CANSA
MEEERKDSNLCEECKFKHSKYKCPGCSFRSCSLPCVKSHKQRTGCTGKRSRTHFVPISQFDDNQLISDYNLLEEVKRVSESAQRMRNKLCRYNHYKLPFHLRSVRSAAASRRTKILFLPSGMAKREKNQTHYDQRKKCIYWTIEWRFHSTDVVLLDNEIDENLNISSIIGNHLKPGPWNHQLKRFCDGDLENLRFFIRKYQKGSTSPFYELDVKVPLRQQLTNRVILEYPAIYVFTPSHNIDFEVIKDVYPSSHKPDFRNFGSNNRLKMGGVPFKEEEIAETDSSLAPQVFDLMKNESSVNSTSPQQFTNQSKSGKVPNSTSRGALSAGAAAGSAFQSPTNKGEQFDELDFDFDQGLIDAYSDLIAEINPDDFLDLEGLLNKEEEETDDLKNLSGDFFGLEGILNKEETGAEDELELEEGEIAE